MLHEGASVEGEMHMLTDAPKDAAETIRGSAPLRGETRDAKGPGSGSTPSVETAKAVNAPAATKPAPTVTPSSSARPGTSGPETPEATTAPAMEAAAVVRRESVAQTLRNETLRVAPRATTTVASYSGPSTSTSNGSRTGSGSSPTSF
jgi:hypothetical protein